MTQPKPATKPAPRRLVPCKGRDCGFRGSCGHYYAFSLPNRSPVDRLCPVGEEEPELIQPHPQSREGMRK